MTNRRSPCLTIWPSLKWMESMKPDTRARTSTVATATNRPVYSSHSVIGFCSGLETVTGGGGGAAPAPDLLSQPASKLANNAATIKRRTPVMGPYFIRENQSRKRQIDLSRSFLYRDRQPAAGARSQPCLPCHGVLLGGTMLSRKARR